MYFFRNQPQSTTEKGWASPRTTKTITQKVSIPAKPIEVYNALIDAKIHSEFTGSKATCNPKVRGEFTAWHGYISGKNLKLDRGTEIVQEWKTTEWPKGYPPSIVQFRLKEKPNNQTELTLVHSRVPTEQADSYRQGWIDSYWEPLKRYFRRKTH